MWRDPVQNGSIHRHVELCLNGAIDFSASNHLSVVFVARCRTEVNVFSARENHFSSCLRTSIGSSYVGTDGPARTVDETQIYLYSCANSPLLQEERIGYGRLERRTKRCVGVRAICGCHCATQNRGWTWGRNCEIHGSILRWCTLCRGQPQTHPQF